MTYTNSDDKGTNFALLVLGNYSYKRYEEHRESWCGCCAGEALSVLGRSSGFQVLIKNVAQNGACTNYLIHWQVLAGSNKMSQYLKQIISIVSL
jgi:hypothetical protein